MIRPCDDAFEEFRLDRGAEFPLLNGKGAFFGRNVGTGFVIHAARFDHRKQLTGGMKIERQVGEVVKPDRDAEGENDKQGNCSRG